MDLNTIGIGLLALPFLYAAYLYFVTPPAVVHIRSGLLVPQQVGKSKYIQSKTGDASMAIESARRKVIQQSGRLNTSAIKETRTSCGTTTGAYETFFLTAICPILKSICPPFGQTYDAGGLDSEFCPVLDDMDNGVNYDAGGIDTV